MTITESVHHHDNNSIFLIITHNHYPSTKSFIYLKENIFFFVYSSTPLIVCADIVTNSLRKPRAWFKCQKIIIFFSSSSDFDLSFLSVYTFFCHSVMLFYYTYLATYLAAKFLSSLRLGNVVILKMNKKRNNFE